jgi:hypothetical protein
MTNPKAETSPSTRGRILAALYLFVVIAGITARSFISDRLVVGDDAERTAANILPACSTWGDYYGLISLPDGRFRLLWSEMGDRGLWTTTIDVTNP